MDDASAIAPQDSILDAAVKELDAADGFATLDYQGREIILMSAESSNSGRTRSIWPGSRNTISTPIPSR